MLKNKDLRTSLKLASVPISEVSDLDLVVEKAGKAGIVMIGEASHGTSDYYLWRAYITKKLIADKEFSYVAVEGDWPECYRLNRYVKGDANSGRSAKEVMTTFNRWPTWMWANLETASFIEWLKEYNKKKGRQVGFYGLDVYSLWDSIAAVIGYLKKKDPEMAEKAINLYHCFDRYRLDEKKYAISTALSDSSCVSEVVTVLQELQRKTPLYDDEPESLFTLEQNAIVAVNAERYYRTMVLAGPDSWNIRDTHMDETLERLMTFHGTKAKAVVWAHNTHIGDARATDMAEEGMINMGELARKHHKKEGVVLIGFGSYEGSVIAADEWEYPPEKMLVPPSMVDSWEDIMHTTFHKDVAIFSDKMKKIDETRGQRAIGVVYNPLDERGNYVPTILPKRYDIFIFIDKTSHLNPLSFELHEDKELPETYPTTY
jgi:erythromycin esterase-like protein